MNYPPPFLFVNKDCDEAVAAVVQQLLSANLQVLQTFDLQAVRPAQMVCSGPNLSVEQCDCHFVVLLVYRDKLPPTSLIAHGHDGKTLFALVDSPEQRAVPCAVEAIRQALVQLESLPGTEDNSPNYPAS